MNPEEAAWAESIRRGDIQTFEQVFRVYYAPLCGFATQMLKDQDQAEELVQDLFTRLWEDRDRLNPNQSLKAYLYTAIRNACLNHVKHLKVRGRFAEAVQAQPTPVSNDPEDMVAAAELELQIQMGIASLPEKCREIFEMSRNQGMKYQEIADELHLSPRTVEVQIGRALKVLRAYLREWLPFILFVWIWGNSK